MSKLADTLRKDGWKLTPCDKLKPGDYVAAINGYSGEREGKITDVSDNKNGTFTVYYGELGREVLPPKIDALWVAPKEYEHLEVRWGADGNKFINISTDPRKPLFCLASLIEIGLISAPDNQVEILDSCKDPETLLKEKPVRSE